MPTIVHDTLQKPLQQADLLRSRRKFRKAQFSDLTDNWRKVGEDTLLGDGVFVLMSVRPAAESPRLVQSYRFHIWVKGVGITTTELTPLAGHFHADTVRFSTEVVHRGQCLLTLSAHVTCLASQSMRTHTLHIDWLDGSSFVPDVREAMWANVYALQQSNEEIVSARIVASDLDKKQKIATWMVAEKKRSGGTEYSVWTKRGLVDWDKVDENKRELADLEQLANLEKLATFPAGTPAPIQVLQITPDGKVKVFSQNGKIQVFDKDGKVKVFKQTAARRATLAG